MVARCRKYQVGYQMTSKGQTTFCEKKVIKGVSENENGRQIELEKEEDSEWTMKLTTTVDKDELNVQ